MSWQKYDKSLYLEQKPHRTFVGKGDKMQSQPTAFFTEHSLIISGQGRIQNNLPAMKQLGQ